MLCCLCKERDANVHLMQFVGDDEPTEANLAKAEKVDLCEDCAKKHNVNDPAGFSMADLLTAMKNPDRK
jgi:protein-arginine kinase activator protein McsA